MTTNYILSVCCHNNLLCTRASYWWWFSHANSTLCVENLSMKISQFYLIIINNTQSSCKEMAHNLLYQSIQSGKTFFFCISISTTGTQITKHIWTAIIWVKMLRVEFLILHLYLLFISSRNLFEPVIHSVKLKYKNIIFDILLM